MPINAYTGLMGSGKSYECVSSVIVPAIKNGRRVVTNVDGIDTDAIRAYCQEKWSISPDNLGHVIHCKNDDVGKPGFLPYGENVDTFCKPGDIICIDEAWRFWGTDCKLLAEHKVFFREHRHFVEPDTKVCCDLVLMVQDIGDLHRTLKVVVEVSFRTTKIKTLGLNKTYRVEMWEGYKQTSRSRVAVENKRYDADLFPLYSSYAGGAGKELQVDGRQNVLRSPKLWILAALVVLVFVFSVNSVLNFFSGAMIKKDQSSASANGVDKSSGSSSKTQTFPVSQIASVSENWRIAGAFRHGNESYVVLANVAGRIRLEHPSAFQSTGLAMVGEVDGERITAWSGLPPASRMPGDIK